jgi:thioredoxin 1
VGLFTRQPAQSNSDTPAPLGHADTEEAFDTEVLRADRPVVVDFWADWCRPCHLIAPEIEALARAWDGRIKVVKVDVEANPAPAARYGVQGIPTVALFDGGRLVAKSVGAKRRPALERDLGLEKLTSPSSASPAGAAAGGTRAQGSAK